MLTSSRRWLARRCRCSSGVGDHAGLVHVWQALGVEVANGRGHFEEMAEAAEQALRHAGLGGQRRGDRARGPRMGTRARAAAGRRGAAYARQAPAREPPPVAAAVARLRCSPCSTASRRHGRSRASGRAHARADRRRAGSRAMLGGDRDYRGRPRDRGRATCAPLCDLLEEQRATRLPVDLRADARPLAVRARTLRRGRAARTARPRARRRATTLRTQMLWRQVQALVDAHRGRIRRGRGARPRGGRDRRADGCAQLQGDALCDLAEVLLRRPLAGRGDRRADRQTAASTAGRPWRPPARYAPRKRSNQSSIRVIRSMRRSMRPIAWIT